MTEFDILKKHPARWFLQVAQMYALVGIGAAIGFVMGAGAAFQVCMP